MAQRSRQKTFSSQSAILEPVVVESRTRKKPVTLARSKKASKAYATVKTKAAAGVTSAATAKTKSRAVTSKGKTTAKARVAGRRAKASPDAPKPYAVVASRAKELVTTSRMRSRAQTKLRCVVGIGASAGGFDAIQEFLRAMPADSGNAFVIVQHLDPARRSLAAELLGKYTKMPVTEATDGLRIEANHVYTNPSDQQISIRQGTLRLEQPHSAIERRLPIDYFFRALGEDQREKAVGIVLSGSGADGAVGLRFIVEEGGLVIVQQPETAQFDGMPKSAINTGVVSAVLPLAGMPQTLVDYTRHPYAAGDGGGFARLRDNDAVSYDRVIQALHAQRQFNFAGYKRTTVHRRILRRMGLRGISSVSQYVAILSAEPKEIDALFSDLLIGVTEFFRDRAAWEILANDVVAPLVVEKLADEPIRAWVAGAATGEEAYSLAMLFARQLEQSGKACPLQVFATDTNFDALATARVGLYPAGIAAQLNAGELVEFFRESGKDHHYQVRKTIRDCIVFGNHNLLKDTPYSKMDVVTCRNLLIYLEPAIQRKVIQILHFALRPGGVLFLGPAETVAPHADLFEPISKRWRIFRRKGADLPREGLSLTLAGRHGWTGGPAHVQMATPRVAEDLAAMMQRLIVDRFSPAAVLVDDQFEIHYFSGSTDGYLAQPKGGPTQNLLTLAREGLRSRLRSAIREARETDATIVVADAQVRRRTGFCAVKLTVAPVARPRVSGAREMLLVVFEDAPKTAPIALGKGSQAAQLVMRLEEELRATKEDLSSTIERLQRAVEDSTAANEEATSVNEEMQTTNEELESSKEELQSMNEELNTVNQELVDKMGELEDVNSDLRNLLESNDIATLCLNKELSIKWFSPAAQNLFALLPADVGRPLTDFAPKFAEDRMIDEARSAMEQRLVIGSEVSSLDHRWYLKRTLPLTGADDGIDGVIITFVDITEIRRKADAEIAMRSEVAQSIERQVEARMRGLRVELFKLALTEERERRVVATELHDEVCQPLAAASLHLIEPAGKVSSPGSKGALQTAVLLLEKAERASRSLMYRLSPPILFDLGLTPALEWLAEELHRAFRLTVNVTEIGDAPRDTLDETVRSVLFRCVRELLINVARHAKVQHAEVAVYCEGERLGVSVTDAGVGFDQTLSGGTDAKPHFGLVSVRERIVFVGGELAIKSIPGEGTVARLTVPLSRSSAWGG